LMRAIEDSPWLDSPSLVEIHAVSAGGTRVSEFSLNFNLTKPQAAANPLPASPAKAKS